MTDSGSILVALERWLEHERARLAQEILDRNPGDVQRLVLLSQKISLDDVRTQLKKLEYAHQ